MTNLRFPYFWCYVPTRRWSLNPEQRLSGELLSSSNFRLHQVNFWMITDPAEQTSLKQDTSEEELKHFLVLLVSGVTLREQFCCPLVADWVWKYSVSDITAVKIQYLYCVNVFNVFCDVLTANKLIDGLFSSQLIRSDQIYLWSLHCSPMKSSAAT